MVNAQFSHSPHTNGRHNVFMFEHRCKPYMVSPAQVRSELRAHFFTRSETVEIESRLAALPPRESIWLGERTLSIRKLDCERVKRLFAMDSMDLDDEARGSGLGRHERRSMDHRELIAELLVRTEGTP